LDKTGKVLVAGGYRMLRVFGTLEYHTNVIFEAAVSNGNITSVGFFQ